MTIPTNRYILLAEDDPDDQQFFQDAFREVNFEMQLVIVNNGMELLKFLSDEKIALPELIFLDLNMPVKNGYESLSDLKSHGRLKNIPVIIYSTSGHPDDIEKMRNAKAHLYIPKTHSFPHLKKVIQRVLVTDFASNLSEPPREKFHVFYEE